MMFRKYKDAKFKTVDDKEIDDWIGTPSALLGELNSVADTRTHIDSGSRYWPKASSHPNHAIKRNNADFERKRSGNRVFDESG